MVTIYQSIYIHTEVAWESAMNKVNYLHLGKKS